MEHLLALEMLNVSKSNVESILCLSEESEWQINLGLQNIILHNLPMMIYLFMGPKNAFALKNLKSITISQCEKLEIVFSTSILRCLSQLSHLRIQECNELKHIIEDDDDDIENQGMSKTYFPVLKTLAVAMCNKLKSVFPISMKKELPPELKVMMIGEAHELKEIFKSVGGDNQKVEIPNLKSVVFVNLPSLCHVQGIQFQAVENHYIQNCKELSPTSLTSSRNFGRHAFRIDGIDFDVHVNLIGLFQQLKNMMAASSQKEMNRTPETKHEFIENVPDLEIPSVTTLPTNSQELTSEESTSQHLLEEIDNTIKLSQGIQVSVEEGTASTSYANTITSSTHLESEYGDGQIGIPFPVSTTDCLNIADVNLGDSHETTQTNNQVSLNDNAAMQVSSTIQQQFHKDDGIIVSGLEMPSAVYSPTNSQGMKISVEDGTTSANAKTITSSTHSKSVSSSSGLSTTSKSETSSPEDGDGKISIPSFSTVNTKPPATKYVDIGDSQEIIAMEDINMLIEEDPLLALLALEKLLTGQFSNSSARVLLQELKTLMDSSSDLDHLVSNQESISKLNSLFHRLNQYQGMLTSDLKDFVEKVQNFFNENIIKHATSQQALKKHNQLLDSKTDIMNKLWSVKSTQTHIDSETSTTNAQIHELSLQIDELRKKLADLENQRDSLKSVANKCD
ncbi:putative NBS-LRR resistance protein, partial [Trifolium pratense]